MRAVVCERLGPPDLLVVRDLDDPVPGPGQALVEVAAAGVNYVDALFVAGRYQIKPPLPFTPGSEVAGTVVALGSPDGGAKGGGDPGGISVGSKVLAFTGLDGYATHVVCPITSLVEVPGGMDLRTAAAFPQSYCTALFALRDRAHLTAGESVLVLGGAGGVGSAAIDVARSLGAARVIAAASTVEKRAACTAAGAEATIDYTSEDLKGRAREIAGGTGVDVVIDPVGGDHAEPALRALGYMGRYLVIGFAGGDIPRLPLNQVLLRNRSVLGVDWGAWSIQNPAENRRLLGELLALVADGSLRPPEPVPYPIGEVARALDDLTSRRVTGKAVLVP